MPFQAEQHNPPVIPEKSKIRRDPDRTVIYRQFFVILVQHPKGMSFVQPYARRSLIDGKGFIK